MSNSKYAEESRIRKIIIWPLVTVVRIILLFFYRFSKSAKEISKLQNKYSGQRCFIIGNGPSLSLEDLSILKNHITFASNRIFDVFENTDWRPTFYLTMDRKVITEYYDSIKKLNIKYKFITLLSIMNRAKRADGFTFLYIYGKYRINDCSYEKKGHSRDISKYISTAYTVSATAIELALYMGFTEIVLVGIDHSYSHTIDRNKIINENNSINNYNITNAHKRMVIIPIDAMESCYKYFEEYTRKTGCAKIYNATRGGKLEVFERVDFDSLF